MTIIHRLPRPAPQAAAPFTAALLAALLLAALLFAVSPRPALAQPYPERPVRIIVPYGQGTALDVAGRFLADRLSARWKQPVIIENKVGASGIIGTEAVARAAADGYTLLFTSSGHVSNATAYAKLPYDPLGDFRPIVQAGASYLVLVVPKSSPVGSVDELLRYLQARPGQVNYGSAGTGNMTHLAGQQLAIAAGVPANAIQYKTHPQALMDTLSGQVFMTFVGLATAAPHIQSGAVKALAVSGPRRSQSLKDVPTLIESGLKDTEIISKFYLLGPAKLPRAIVDKVSADVLDIVRSDEFAQFTLQQGLERDAATADELAVKLPQEQALWARMLRSAGVTPQ
ncbi:MAG: Bug family tripartite tricarboxylate transporter substrate binding protein [Burkholderiaceae bacterium]